MGRLGGIRGLCRHCGRSCTIARRLAIPTTFMRQYPYRLAKSSLDRPDPTTDIPAASSMSMRIGRTILTFLVALSLAIAPVPGAFAMQKDEVTASNEVVPSAHHYPPD